MGKLREARHGQQLPQSGRPRVSVVCIGADRSPAALRGTGRGAHPGLGGSCCSKRHSRFGDRRFPVAAQALLKKLKLDHIEWILLLTAFAAGSVDVVSFASLGGVFASAMTGNFALLAYYVAQSDSQAAMGSVVALTGFVGGCAIGVLQRRGRVQAQALNLLLASEMALPAIFRLVCALDPARRPCTVRAPANIAAGTGDGTAGGYRPKPSA